MKNIVEFAAGSARDTVALAGHTEEDWAVLNAVKDTIVPWGQEIGSVYGESLWSNPETAAYMEKLNRADQEQAVGVWYEKLASGRPGDVFWAETCLIGLYHAASGVQNRHVVALTVKIDVLFLQKCQEAFEPAKALEVYTAFKRIFGVATALMVDSYLQAIMLGMEDIGMNERLVGRIRNVAIRKMIEQAREALPLIVWNDALSVGIDSIDQQHQKLVVLLNSLRDSSIQGAGNDKLKQILAELTNYTVEHFSYEERMFKETGYPGADEHKKAHDNLVRQVAELNDKFQAGQAVLGGELFKFLRSWLNGHIRGTDKLYTKFMQDKGIK